MRNVFEWEGDEWDVENQQQQKSLAGVERIEKSEGLSPGLVEKMQHKGNHSGKCIEKCLKLAIIFGLTYVRSIL